MTTCFTPVADDLRVGDVLTGLQGRTFAAPRVVLSVERTQTRVLITLDGGSRPEPVEVERSSDIDLLPPF